MKILWVVLSLLAASVLVVAPAAGAEPPGSAPAISLSRVDQVMISAQEFSDWMAHHRTRMEIRDTNHAIEQMCDRLQDAERRMSLISGDPSDRPDKARAAQIAGFGEQIGAVARELATLHASIRRIAEASPAAPDSSADLERQRLQVRQADLLAEIDRSTQHSNDSHAWVLLKPAPRGLDEMSRDLDLARDTLRGMVLSLGRIGADPSSSRDTLRDLTQVQDCSRSLLQALSEAQDRIVSLAGPR